MRAITAIVLTLAFAISQYSRHLGYLECRILNILKPDAGYCDCEQLLSGAESPDPAPFSGTHHLHLLADEFFERPETGSVQNVIAKTSPVPPHFIVLPLAGALNRPWQPPEFIHS